MVAEENGGNLLWPTVCFRNGVLTLGKARPRTPGQGKLLAGTPVLNKRVASNTRRGMGSGGKGGSYLACFA